MSRRRISAAALCLSLLSTILYSQGTSLGTIRGQVTDSTGAVLPEAQVQITDVYTAVVRRVSTDRDGNYEAAGLAYGDYEVVASAQGFSRSETARISLRTA